MSVARLYHHCAPSSEVGLVTRAMVRLLKGHRLVFANQEGGVPQ